MDPLEALNDAIVTGQLLNRRTTFAKPGAIVALVKGENREALRRLTSDQALKVRFEPWMVERPDEHRRRLMRDFDLQLRR